MKQSDECITELATALSKAQCDFKEPQLDALNPFFKSKYATLTSVLRAVQHPLSKNGLSIVQTVDSEKLITTLLHASGQWISSEYPLHVTKRDPQGFGAAVTYARRYSVKALLSLAEEDNDGNEHVTAPKNEVKKEPKQSILSDAQIARLWAISKNNKWNTQDVVEYLVKNFNSKSTRELTKPQYDQVCSWLESNKPNIGSIPH